MVSKFSLSLRLRLRSLGLDDKLESYEIEKAELPDKLGPAYYEYGLIKLFIIDIDKLTELKAIIAKNFHIQPSEIDKMNFWEYKLFINHLNKQVEEENERQKAEMDKYHVKEHMDAARPSNIKKMTDTSRYTPQMPNFGSMKAPSFKF